MKNFVNFNINGKLFDSKFCNMIEGIEKEGCILRKNFKRLKTIETNLKFFQCAKWISEIYICYDEFYPNFDTEDPLDFPFAKNEKQFQAAVTNIILQIQEDL
jgi:hypothetical protein